MPKRARGYFCLANERRIREKTNKTWFAKKTRGDHYHVSRLLNFFVTTLPMSIPSLSTIRWARSGCEVPLKTLMFGILLCNTPPRDLSKFARNKLLARTGCDTGITENRKRTAKKKNGGSRQSQTTWPITDVT